MSTWYNHKKRQHPSGVTRTKSSISKKKRKSNKTHHFDPSSNLWTHPDACLSWLISLDNKNHNLNDFLTNYWSKKPYLLKRNNRNYYKTKGIDIDLNTLYKIIEKNEGNFTFGENIICKYYNTINKTETNAINRGELVELKKIKQLFNDKQNGATIQFLHSHFYHYEIGELIFSLESFFGNFVSSNIYVTPNQKQGLKAHWDDIEAFILQIKGKKHWKLYRLNEPNDKYPIKESKDDLDINDSNKYSFIMECVLQPGDLLYFPRGIVHFAQCVDDENNDYSLHLTISTNQNNYYGEFMKKMMNECMDEMIKNDVELRQNVPINVIGINNNNDMFRNNISKFMGNLKRNIFENKKYEVLMNKVLDQMAVRFVSNRYPPTKFLKPFDFEIYGKNMNKMKKETVIEAFMGKKDELIEFVEDNDKRGDIINEESSVRVMNPDWMRMISANDVNMSVDLEMDDMEDNNKVNAFLEDDDDKDEDDDKYLLFSCVRNDHKSHLMAYNEDMSSEPMLATANDKEVVCVLNDAYPEWIKVKELITKCDKCDAKRIYDLLFALWAEGLISTDKHH